MRGWTIAGIVVLASLSGGLAMDRWHRSNAPAGAAGAPAHPAHVPGQVTFDPGAAELGFIRAARAEMSAEPVAAPFAGRVAYDETLTTRVASPIAGRVLTIHASPGATVNRGDPLLTLDAPEYAQAVADVRRAESDVRLREQSLRRARELHGGGVMARKDLEAAEADAAAAHAEVTRAQARLANLSAAGSGERFVIRAPIGGRVVERQVNPGAEVRPDTPQPLFVISDIASVWVLFELAERDLGKVRSGERIDIRADAWPDRVFAATVTQIGDTLDRETRRVIVRATVANPDRALKPEMYVRVNAVGGGGPQSVKLPVAAIITDGLYANVFVQTGPQTYLRRRVEPGLQTAESVYVREGLAEGELVVTQGALLLNSELTAQE